MSSLSSTTTTPTPDLSVPLPPSFDTMDVETQQQVVAYLQQLNSLQQKAYVIAIEHLGSSFDLLRTGGYVDWKKTLSHS